MSWSLIGTRSRSLELMRDGLAISIIFIMAPIVAVVIRPRPDYCVDFFQEWASARNYFRGYPIYTNHQIIIQEYLKITPPSFEEMTVEVNAHPPTSVLPTIPFGLLGYSDAVLAW